jgi:crooked neck
VKTNPLNYDAWFDYIRLLESDANPEQVQDTYERAIANLPPSKVGVVRSCTRFFNVHVVFV